MSEEYGSGVYDVMRVLPSTLGLERFLTALAELALGRVPGADGCGITVVRHGRPESVAGVGSSAPRLDEVQYANDDGPCLQALRTGREVVVAEMLREERWGSYPVFAAAAGTHSSLSLPIAAPAHIVGVLNLYASEPDAFTGADLTGLRSIASQAAGAIALAQRIADVQGGGADVQTALRSRAVIDQATGVVMAQQHCSADKALKLLRAASRRRDVGLAEVCAQLVARRGAPGSEPAQRPQATPRMRASAYVRLGEALAGLLQASHRASFERLPALLDEAAARAGAGRPRLFVADLQQDVLREVTGRGLDAGEGGQELRIDSTLAGRAFQSEQQTASGDGRNLWIPVMDGTERLGVLQLHHQGDDTVSVGDAEARAAVGWALASMAGLLLVSKRTNSDSYARLARTRTMSVSAEMQWTLMPPMTFANDRVTISAAMEPAYKVAGDAFDYAVGGNVAHLAVFDAMGHDTAAGLTASLAMATSRNQRRQGASLDEASHAIERALLQEFGHTRYATGILADLDLDTGVLTWVNRGHLLPIIIRGERWAATAHCPPAGPMGTGLHLPVALCREQLEPGDRLLFYTDGITEARDTDGAQFGIERFTDFVIRHSADSVTVAEMLRRLIHSVLDYHQGRLDDDATVLFCQWNGPV